MKCPNCGKEIANDSQFCEFCGTQLKKSTKNPITVWIILALLLCAVVIGVFVYSEHNDQQAAIEVANQRAEEARIAKEEAERKLLAEESARIEAERRAADEKKRREEKQKSARREELLRLGYVDLGLPSGTLWQSKDEVGFYTYYEAIQKFNRKLPTKEQMNELYNKCKWEWTDRGYLIMGPNGNSILLNAAGARSCEGEIHLVGRGGFYWSSTSESEDTAWYLKGASYESGIVPWKKCNGYSVRCVQVP